MLYDAIREPACASWRDSRPFGELQDWGRSQLLTSADLLATWWTSGNRVLGELLAGWVQAVLATGLSAEGVPPDYRPDVALTGALERWITLLRPRVSAPALQAFSQAIEGAIQQLARSVTPQRAVRVLFVGDCIQFEILTALLGPSTNAGIRIEPTLVSERVQPVLRNRLREYPPNAFDLIVFAPFSHRYMPQYDALLAPKSMFWSGRLLSLRVHEMLADVCQTADALAEHFDCPVSIHNTAGTVQSHGLVPGAIGNLVSLRARRYARRAIRAGIDAYLGDRPAANVHLMDEAALTRDSAPSVLGRAYLVSHAFHPTPLGVALGRGPCFRTVYTVAWLLTRKLVICDLDDTLWEGAIGEGAVTHHLDRQAMLKGLRERGVLLAICSRNSPGAVRWTGARLDESDFAAQRINWNSKVSNIASLRDELNLRTEDFVFVDDRPEEREQVRHAFPEIVTLDATDPDTWRLLQHWQSMRPRAADDRNRWYADASRRKRALDDLTRRAEDEAAALASLQLVVRLRAMRGSDLKRAAELVNRTNQFNLCGSRTTVRALADGLGTRHWIIGAEVEDKFGNMGVVGVMQATRSASGVEIPIFVLSCRAFGYGIEHALLSSIKDLASDDSRVVGHYAETAMNAPARELYPKSGLTWNGQAWVGRVGDIPVPPAWLTIENGVVEPMQT